MKKKKQQLWDRRIGEGVTAYALFWKYIEQGAADRDLKTLATESGRKHQTIISLSSKFEWGPRSRAFDKYLLDIQIKVLENQTKVESVLWAKREIQHRHKYFDFAERLYNKASEMLDSPLYIEVTEAYTEVIVNGEPVQIPTKISRHPVRWSFKDVKALAELSDQMARLAIGLVTARTTLEVHRPTDSTHKLADAKAAMMNWVKKKLDVAVARVCINSPGKTPEEVRAQLLSQVPLWFAESFEIEDPSPLMETLNGLQLVIAPALSLEPETESVS